MVRLIVPDDPDLSLPLTIGSGDSVVGPRLGGRPPAAVLPPKPAAGTRYFLTVPFSIEPLLDLTVFLSFDFDQSLEVSGTLGEGQGLVQVVTHAPRARGEADQWQSEFPPHPLIVGAPRTDWLRGDDDSRVVRSSHKLGGRPYFMHGTELDEEVDRLLAAAYRQTLQVDFPGSDDAPLHCGWPFGDGVFHILGTPPFSPEGWRWYWEN